MNFLRSITFVGFWSVAVATNAHAFWVSPSQAEKELESMNFTIAYTEKFGAWRDQGQGGAYRLVVLDGNEKYPHSLVFLQWIKQAPGSSKDGKNNVVVSVPIKEINSTGLYKLNEPKVAGVDGALGGIAELTGVNNYTHSVQSIRIQPNNVGQYSLTFINGPTERAASVMKQVENAVFAIPASK